jgi:cAMP-dependent protein kinase regulator
MDLKIQNLKNRASNTKARSSVSAEVYGMFNKKEEFTPKIIPKSDDQKAKIHEKVIQSFLFNCLEEKDLATVIDAMEEKNYNSGETVIQQGDPGDVLYLIYSGTLDCYKKFVRCILKY